MVVEQPFEVISKKAFTVTLLSLLLRKTKPLKRKKKMQQLRTLTQMLHMTQTQLPHICKPILDRKYIFHFVKKIEQRKT